MEQDQNGRTPSPASEQKDLGRSFEGQGSPSYGGDLGVSFKQHNQSPELRVEPHKKSGHTWIWVVALLAILLAIFLIVRLTHAKGASSAAAAGGGRHGQTGPSAITAGQSRTGNIDIYDDAIGTVTPVYTVTLYSQITGKVLAVHYREGQIVEKGAPLVDIDPTPYEATLTQAEGTLQHDQGVLAEAKIDLDRYRKAYAANAIAKQQLDDQEQVVIQDEGTVQTDQGTVAYDKIQLAYCHITAPITGRVGLRLVDPGNTVFSGSSSTLAVITQLQPITVVFNVSEDDLPQVQEQLKGKRQLTVDAYDRSDDKQIESGKLISLDNQIDTTTGTLKFRATFPNKGLVLFPNQFVNARLLVKTLNDVVLVPTAAVQHNGTAAFVYIVNQLSPTEAAAEAKKAPAAEPASAAKSAGPPSQKPNAKVTVQAIDVLTTNEKEAAVTGIPAGVTLATSGFDRLEDGAAVQVHPAGGKSGQGKATTSSSGASTTGQTAP
jgi:multidrug efflux system membrane fusion protein